MAIEYAKEREQFGRPIGAYQAVSHRLAEMLWDVEEARSLTYYAAWCADANPEALALAAHMAKAGARPTPRTRLPTMPSRPSAASGSRGSTTSTSSQAGEGGLAAA